MIVETIAVTPIATQSDDIVVYVQSEPANTNQNSAILIISIASVVIVGIGANAVVRWRETGSLAEAWRFAFDAIRGNQVVQDGVEAVINRLDDDGKKAVNRLLNTLDPLTQFVPGDWDSETIAYFRGLLNDAPGSSFQDALEDIKNNPPLNVPRGDLKEPDVPKLPVGIPLVYFGYAKQADGRQYYEANELPGVDTGERVYAVAPGYKPVLNPEMISNDKTGETYLSPVPDVHYDPDTKGFKFALANKAGRFGYRFDLKNWVLAGNSRYALIVRYSHELNPVVNKDGSPTLYIGGALHSSGLEHVLKKQPVIAGSDIAQWVIETSRDYGDMAVSVGPDIPWAVLGDNSYVTILDIEFLPVVDGYGGHKDIERV